MHNKGKYAVGEILTENGDSNFGAVIVNETFSHGVLRKMFVPGSIVGGGFFDIDGDGVVRVYDKSVALEVASRPEDATHVARAVGLSTLKAYKCL